MAARIVWLNERSGGSLVLDEQRIIAESDPLIADVFCSLYIDAPASVGDPAPESVQRQAYWAAAFDSRAIRGSKLWMVPFVRPVAVARTTAAGWAQDALEWLVRAGRLRAVTATPRTAAPARSVVLDIVLTLPDGKRRSFALDVPYAV